VLLCAVSIGISRNIHLANSIGLLNDMFVSDNWVNWAQVGVVVLTMIFILFIDSNSFTRNSYYYDTLLFTLTIIMLMTWLVAAWNFITFYLILEGISLIFYTLITRTFAFGGIAAGLTYFSLGAFASVLLLAGLVSITAAVGSLDFSVVAAAVNGVVFAGESNLLLVTGLTLVMLSVFFKLSIFPAHVWTPNVYDGTTLEVLWVFAVIAKYAFFIVFMRMCVLFFTPGLMGETNFWITTSCLGSLIIGAVGAFLATTVKRFVAYTAINQMGFLFIGLTTASFDGMKSVMSYLYIYMLANVLFFGAISLLQSKKVLTSEMTLRSLKDMTVIKKEPVLMSMAIVSLLSLSGLPPLAGFIGKYSLWLSLLNKYLHEAPAGLHENLLYILIASVLLSLLSTFYYLRLIKVILFDNFGTPAEPTIEIRNMFEISIPMALLAVLGAVTIGWGFMLYELDTIWTRLTLSLTASFTNASAV
jgi:NADH-quinone oxidoreductase subunit N